MDAHEIQDFVTTKVSVTFKTQAAKVRRQAF